VMSEATHAVLDVAPHTFEVLELKGNHVTYQFEVDGSDRFTIEVHDGSVRLDEGPSKSPADCTISANDEDMARILLGKQNVMTAALQGLILVSGDLSAAQRLPALLRVLRAGDPSLTEETIS